MPIKTPNVFVSYTWENDEHKEWVRILAAQLRTDGVNVILDQWETSPGDQLPEFMERAVRDIDFVLIICTPTYKQKSDERLGGTGYEGDIMTGEVFSARNRRKFIPVLRIGDKNTAVPTWLSGVFFIDLREGINNRHYEDLVRTLFDKRHKAPALGMPPNYITDGSSSEHDKNIIFISHSSPDGDDVARWLSMQLINQGYRVYCDLLGLQGGKEKQQIQELIVQRACKFLFIHTRCSDTNSSANEELQVAYDLMRREDISHFLIPIQLESVENSTNIMIRSFTPIVFIDNWAIGFRQLLENLELSGVAKSKDVNPELSSLLWNKLYDPDGGVVEKPELYDSNWFPLVESPSLVYFHSLQRKGSIGQITCGDRLPWPGVQHSIYLISFAPAAEFSNALPPDISISETAEVKFEDFQNGSYQSSKVPPEYFWNILTDLLNQAWETYVIGKGLGTHYLANGRICHYFKFGAGGDSRITYRERDGNKAFRSVMGFKTIRTASGAKEKRYWHFGIQGKALLYPQLLFIIKAHVVFSDDGYKIWKSKARLHKARRSWCRLWWNEIWRGRLLASMAFLADGQENINIAVGNGVTFAIASKPLLFNSSFTYSNPIDNPQQEEVDWDENPEELLDIDDATKDAGFSGEEDTNG